MRDSKAERSVVSDDWEYSTTFDAVLFSADQLEGTLKRLCLNRYRRSSTRQRL